MKASLPTEQDDFMMEKALEEGRRAIVEGKAGVAALLLKGDDILALDHNNYVETRDETAHAEMTVLRKVARELDQMSAEEKAQLTLYSTLQPCLMCFSAISFVGIKRVVFSAWNEDGILEVQIAHGISVEQINEALVRGPIELVPGVRREEGKQLLAWMGKQR